MVRKNINRELNADDKSFIRANINDSPFALSRDLNVDIAKVRKYLNSIRKKNIDYDAELAKVEERISKGDTSTELMEQRNALLIKIATKIQKETPVNHVNFQGERNYIF